MAESEVEYTKPTSQIDAEARLARERGEADPSVGVARTFAVEGNDLSEYVGVAPEYQNYAEDTHKPGEFTEVEGDLVERQKVAISTDVPEGVDNVRKVPKTEEKEVDQPERQTPKQATFNIPAVNNEGQVVGDEAVLESEVPSGEGEGSGEAGTKAIDSGASTDVPDNGDDNAASGAKPKGGRGSAKP